MKRGVTFVELLTVIVIVSILATTIYVSLDGSTEDAEQAWITVEQRKLQVALNAIWAASYTADLGDSDWQFAESLPQDKLYGFELAEGEDFGAKATEEEMPMMFRPTFHERVCRRINSDLDAMKYLQMGFVVVMNGNGLESAFLGPTHSMVRDGVNLGSMPLLFDFFHMNEKRRVDPAVFNDVVGMPMPSSSQAPASIPQGFLSNTSWADNYPYFGYVYMGRYTDNRRGGHSYRGQN